MHQIIQLSNHEDIQSHQKAQRAKIVDAYNRSVDSEKTALLITKGEFDEQYPADKFERYSLQSVTKFREDINKADDIEDKDDAFRKATADLKHFVVTEGERKAIVFVRQKESGE